MDRHEYRRFRLYWRRGSQPMYFPMKLLTILLFGFSLAAQVNFTASTTVCRVQMRKMHTAIASTVLSVRSQFLRRCLRMSGANFISVGQHSLVQMALDVRPRSRPRIVGHHHDGLAEFLVEGLHQVQN